MISVCGRISAYNLLMKCDWPEVGMRRMHAAHCAQRALAQYEFMKFDAL